MEHTGANAILRGLIVEDTAETRDMLSAPGPDAARGR
jgi:hypothetical protein